MLCASDRGDAMAVPLFQLKLAGSADKETRQTVEDWQCRVAMATSFDTSREADRELRAAARILRLVDRYADCLHAKRSAGVSSVKKGCFSAPAPTSTSWTYSSSVSP